MTNEQQLKWNRSSAARKGWMTRRLNSPEWKATIAEHVRQTAERKAARARHTDLVDLGIRLGIYPEGTLTVDGLPVIPGGRRVK